MQKITIAESDIRQAFEGIECPHIVKSTIWHEHRSGYLEAIANILIDKGMAHDAISAIRFLVNEAPKNGNGNSKVSLSHLQRIPSNGALYKKLDIVIGKEAKKMKHNDLTRVFGVKSHVTIPNLFSGHFKSVVRKDAGFMSQVSFDFVTESEELPLYAEKVELKKDEDMFSTKGTLNHIRRIEGVAKKLLKAKEFDLFPEYHPRYQELISLMLPIFSRDLLEILEIGKRNKESEYLAFLTLLTWVTALSRYKEKESLILFKEISLMPHAYDVGLGRIDALAVVKINNKKPTPEQKDVLRRLSCEKFKSVGHLIQKLVQVFGNHLTLRIYDWKFAVGDGDNGIQKTLNIIHTNNIEAKPLLKHQRQMDRYLSTAHISYAMVASNDAIDPGQLWKETDLNISGEIHYFLPDHAPIVHMVSLNEGEKKEVFRSQVVDNYSDGEQLSKIMEISKTWLRLGIGIVEKGIVARTNNATQLLLPGLEASEKGKVSKVIKDSVDRVYLDEFGIVEQKGSEEKPFNKLHYNKLIEEAEKGSISLGRRFNFARGGFIPCFLHGDKTPSLSINLKKGVWKCFGCGKSGTFAKESIPDDLQDFVGTPTKRFLNRSFSEIQKLVIPERHKEIMLRAQNYLRLTFFKSAGEKYLQDVRGLDPGLSWKLGAGFDDGGLIPYLLDMKFTYDELILYGFVNIQSWVKESVPFVQMLKRRGYSVEELRREVPDVDENKKPIMVWGLPIPILENRVTYPLDINGIIVNFYGRSVDPNCKKEYAHQKTRCNDNVPQGGFNITNAMKQAILKGHKNNNRTPELFLTESPIDVDTFIQRSDTKEWGGIVGTGNEILEQILAFFPGNITVAYDNDPSKLDAKDVERGRSGQRATMRFVAFLKSVLFEYQVFDFTEPFAKKHPDYNDINRYWVTMLKAFRERGSPIEIIPVILNRKRLLPEAA